MITEGCICVNSYSEQATTSVNQSLRVLSNLLAAGALPPKAAVEDVIPVVLCFVRANINATSSQHAGLLTKVYVNCIDIARLLKWNEINPQNWPAHTIFFLYA